MHVTSFESLPSPDSVSDALESCEITGSGMRVPTVGRPRPVNDGPAANVSGSRWGWGNLALSGSERGCPQMRHTLKH